MSENPLDPQVPITSPPRDFSWLLDFIKAYWLRLILLALAVSTVISFVASGFDFLALGLGMLIGLIRGLTRYRAFLAGKSIGQIAGEERFRRLERKAYNQRIGSIDLGTAPGLDHINALFFWLIGRLIRLMIFMIAWPLVEIFFQSRFLIPAFQDARTHGVLV